ncbi:NAD(P)-binding protein [Coprinopsis marcescibilis]|uniref:Inositol-3-phosphate synthase n=1 Tax=Coprinopsis marcescibilis TaxID=230819 RepID=A0A5C3KC58_COPMA|nr:NAD(P)-binding protein [Coprinopsis marcescibilis]
MTLSRSSSSSSTPVTSPSPSPPTAISAAAATIYLPNTPNYSGSLLRASTFRLGVDSTTGKDVNVPVSELLPIVHPNDLVLGGWDISAVPMEKAMTHSMVVDYDLQRQFRSKEISKSSVVNDMVANRLLFKAPELNEKGAPKDKGEHPDHVVVIKYVPAVGDSKRAINEYFSEIFCGGRSVVNIFNECEDSLLATPLILDLSILAELLTRVKYQKVGEPEFKPLHSVLSLLSYMLKAPLVKPGTEVINRLNRQRNSLEAFLKACLGLEGSSDLLLETRLW